MSHEVLNKIDYSRFEQLFQVPDKIDYSRFELLLATATSGTLFRSSSGTQNRNSGIDCPGTCSGTVDTRSDWSNNSLGERTLALIWASWCCGYGYSRHSYYSYKYRSNVSLMSI